MPSLQQIADHLGISKNATAKQIQKLGIPYKTMSLEDIARAYMERQRGIASGHIATLSKGDEDLDLMQERAKKERCERELLEMKLAKREMEVLKRTHIEYLWQWMAGDMKKLMYQADKEIVKQTKKRYGVEIDIAIIHQYTNTALARLEE